MPLLCFLIREIRVLFIFPKAYIIMEKIYRKANGWDIFLFWSICLYFEPPYIIELFFIYIQVLFCGLDSPCFELILKLLGGLILKLSILELTPNLKETELWPLGPWLTFHYYFVVLIKLACEFEALHGGSISFKGLLFKPQPWTLNKRWGYEL